METVKKEKVETKATEVVDPIKAITGKWRVEPCRKTWLHAINPNHDGSDLFSGAQIWIGPARRVSNPDIVVTGLTNEEREGFEQLMFLQPGTLSPYNLKYWSDKNNQVKVPKGGLTLDCDSNLKHKLWFKILRASKKVAQGRADQAMNSTAEVVLYSIEEETLIKSANTVIKSKAYVKFNQMTANEKANYLKVYNEGRNKVDGDSKPELIDQTLGAIIEKSPEDFLATFDNPYYKDYILLEDLLSKNIIVRKGGRFSIQGGVELGLSKTDVVLALRADDFQETKIGLIAKLEATK